MRHVRPTHLFRALIAGAALFGVSITVAAEPKSSTPQTPPEPAGEAGVDADAVYEAGRQLFQQYAPPEVKAEYDFPSKEQWDAALGKLQTALQSDSMEDLAAYAPQARAVLSALRAAGAEPEMADWLEQRLDEVEGASEARAMPPQPPESPPVRPAVPRPKPLPAAVTVPYYDLWFSRVRTRPVPARAAKLMPVLRNAFEAEGVPPALAWLAEAESSFNPSARSPAGAKGLFQLMPDTAKQLGLDTFLPDERTSPEKSAHAAARYLRQLHAKFGDWPLTLAAYNAGEGRISRALASRKATGFAAIADALPAETRMYVPKVCALVAARTGVNITGR